MTIAGLPRWGSGFDIQANGVTTLTHIFTNSNAGTTMPTLSTSSPISGNASFDYTKAGGVALSLSDNLFAAFSASPGGLSTSFKFRLVTKIGATAGRAAGLVSYSIDGEAWGVVADGAGNNYPCILSGSGGAPAHVAWTGTTSLATGVGNEYRVTYTVIPGGDGSGFSDYALAKMILRDLAGSIVEESPWIRVGTFSLAIPYSYVGMGIVAATSAWTDAFSYKIDDALTVAGGVHCGMMDAYVLGVTGNGTYTGVAGPKEFTGVPIGYNAGGPVTIDFNAAITGVVNFYLHYPGGAVASQRITAITPNTPAAGQTRLTLAAALGADPAAAAGTCEIYGLGVETSANSVPYVNVDEALPSDEATSTLEAINTANKTIGFALADLASVGGPASIGASEALFIQPWVRWRAFGGAGTSVLSVRYWDGAYNVFATIGPFTQTVAASAWIWAPQVLSQTPRPFRVAGAEWDVTNLNAVEVGVQTSANNTTNTRQISFAALEVFHHTETDNVYGGNPTLREEYNGLDKRVAPHHISPGG